jgi:predicted short-subunit dehydrogenase-like oxidoreductase (DUF2520 family)
MKADGQRTNRQAGRVRKGIAVIGAGNWGSSLAAGVVAAGIPLREVVVRKASRRRPGGVVVVGWEKAKLDAETLWICVPDGEIVAVAEKIAERRADLRGQLVIHSSGAMTVEALEAARRTGATVAGIAPVFSFPTKEPLSFEGVMFVVESPAGRGRKPTALVRKLGGRPIEISSPSKVLYHAAATMASPLLVSALQAAVETARLAGLSARDAEAVVKVLATATLSNFFEKGAGRSFSGAFARGDAGTVELHLQGLLGHPTLSDLYMALARNAVSSLPVKNGPELKRVLDSFGSRKRVRD